MEALGALESVVDYKKQNRNSYSLKYWKDTEADFYYSI